MYAVNTQTGASFVQTDQSLRFSHLNPLNIIKQTKNMSAKLKKKKMFHPRYIMLKIKT